MFSFVGFAAQEVVIGGQTSLTIRLKEEVNVLNEVVAVGYQTLRKSDLTGAVSNVKARELNLAAPTLGQALVGKLAGVQVAQVSGAPYVRGVVLITTKRGKDGKGKLDYEYQFGINPVALARETNITRRGLRGTYNGTLSYELIPGLNVRANVGLQTYNEKYEYCLPTSLSSGNNAPYSLQALAAARATAQTTAYQNALGEFTATYTRQFDRHNLSLLAGYTAQRTTSDQISVSAQGETVNSLRTTTGVGGNVTPDLVKDYEEGDSRRDYSIKYTNAANVRGYFITKFRDASSGATTQGLGGNDWILLRYADVILMLADVNQYLGDEAAAIGFLDQVRERARLDLYAAARANATYNGRYPTLKLAILHERRWSWLSRISADSTCNAPLRPMN